jgi:hypothetical protein
LFETDKERIMVVSILIILLIAFLVNCVPYMSKTVVSDNKKIRPDATIINISHEKVKHGRSRYIKTIVEFSDGVEYHTYETRYEPRLGYTQIIVDNDVVEKIKDKAIKEHRKLEAKHPYNPAANPLFYPGRITLSEKTLAEFNDDALLSIADCIEYLIKKHCPIPSDFDFSAFETDLFKAIENKWDLKAIEK